MKGTHISLSWLILSLVASTSFATPITNKDTNIVTRSFTLAHSLHPRHGVPTLGPEFQPGALVLITQDHRYGTILPSSDPRKVKVYLYKVLDQLADTAYFDVDGSGGVHGLETRQRALKIGDKLQFKVGRETPDKLKGRADKFGNVVKTAVPNENGDCTVSIRWNDESKEAPPTTVEGPRMWFKLTQ